MVSVYVDADASPVTEDVVELAGKHAVHIVCNRHHRISCDADNVTVHCSSDRADGADHYIYNHSSRGDIVVTDDLGLAGLVLAGGRRVIRFRGEIIDNEQIDQRLQIRHVAAKTRRAGGRTKGPPPFTPEDRKKFRRKFKSILKVAQQD